MTTWVLNFWMWLMYMTNPGAYQQLVQQGVQPYNCMVLTSNGFVSALPSACAEMPEPHASYVRN